MNLFLMPLQRRVLGALALLVSAATTLAAVPAKDPAPKHEARSLRECLQPAIRHGGFRMDGFILWCPSVIKVDDTYHMFASRWPAQYGLGGWTQHSECVRATSTTLLGPYVFQEVVLRKRPDNWDNTRVHNVKVVKARDKFLLYHIDTANETGLAVADAITGPWTRRDKPVMRVSNPAILVKPDASIYVFGRLRDQAAVNRGIAFTAASFEGPYSGVANGANLLPDNCELEDPTIWWANNQFNVLLNDWKGKATGISKAGAQYFSADGLRYSLMSRDPVFTKTVVYDDQTSETFQRRERPFVYVNEKQEVIALFTACLPANAPARIVAQPVDRYYPGNRLAPTVRPRVFLLDARQLEFARQRIQDGDSRYTAALRDLLQEADALLKAKPVSVMDKKVTPPSGDKHDYMSQAPYFWPDPKSSNGLPYIRRDGERNPEISKISDHGNILTMPEKVQTLALAWYFTGKESYAGKATEMLRVWFLNPATRMNPHFNYAQAIPGVNTGRGIGLIESRGLTKVVDAVGLLSGSPSWTPADQSGLEQWFGQFLRWMRESDYGCDEAAAKNNHGTYYDLQVASFALFVGDGQLAAETLANAREKRIAIQIQPDGKQPLELVRTRAWSYSTGNLSGLMSLAKLGACAGVDLWHYETPDGRSLRKALDYLLPFALREKPWPHPQLGGWSPEGIGSLVRQAALALNDSRYRELTLKLAGGRRSEKDLLLSPELGPVVESN